MTLRIPRVHSPALRVWHWLDAVVVNALIITYFLRKFLTSHTRALVQHLNDMNYKIAETDSKPLIRDMVDHLWVWHIYIGYALTVLFIWRMVLLFTRNEQIRGHNSVVKWSYVLFYFLQLFMIISGLILVFGDSFHIAKSVVHTIHEVHEFVMWFFLAFVITHVAGVFIAENTGDPGIVSAMINGKQDRE
jgi:Ni/Fe-hydrogenase 1 B-type cytochrome subunit